MPSTPLRTGVQTEPFQHAILETIKEPGLVHPPPAYTTPLPIASASTPSNRGLPRPSPSADHVVPFHRPMFVTVAPPAVVKIPPTYRSLPSTASARASPLNPTPLQLLPFHRARPGI